MGEYLTISALIDRCAPYDKAQRAAWARRARHWAMASQVLPKPPKARRGSGHHRRYRSEDVYLMAIMFRLSDSTLPVGTLDAISELIQQYMIRAPDWNAVKSGSADPNTYLSIIFTCDGEPGADIQPGPLPDFDEVHDGALIVLNISVIFEKIRAQEAMKYAPQDK